MMILSFLRITRKKGDKHGIESSERRNLWLSGMCGGCGLWLSYDGSMEIDIYKDKSKSGHAVTLPSGYARCT